MAKPLPTKREVVCTRTCAFMDARGACRTICHAADLFARASLPATLTPRARTRARISTAELYHALAVQAADQAVIAALQNVFTKPSPEYIAKYNEIVAELTRVAAVAATYVTPAEQSAASLAAIDAKIKALNDDSKAIRTAADAQVRTLEAANKLIQEGLVATTAAINARAQAEIDGINALLSATLGTIAAEQGPLLAQQLAAQIALLNSITGGMPVQAFMAQEAAKAAGFLEEIRNHLADLLKNGLPAGAAPPAAAVPGTVVDIAANTLRTANILQAIANSIGAHQMGTPWTHAGLAVLHEGEAVLPYREAELYRSGLSPGLLAMLTHGDATRGWGPGVSREPSVASSPSSSSTRASAPYATAAVTPSASGRGGTTTVTIAPGAIVITGVSDPEKAAAEAIKKLEALLRERGYVDWR